MKKLRIYFLSDKKGVSHAVSAVIITAVIITLVIVASMYAYQVMEQQKAMAEFECAKESILAFNDALENVARTGRQAARSVRFTTEYGHVELLQDAEILSVNATVDGSNIPLYNDSSGLLRYYIQNRYVNFWEDYQLWILGDRRPVVNTTESFGRALIQQQSDLVSITLNYRVRAMKTSVINVAEDDQEIPANIVDIWIIKVTIEQHSSYIHDFDLMAACTNVETISKTYPEDGVLPINSCKIDVILGGEQGEVFISLEDNPEKILFNTVITEVLVTV